VNELARYAWHEARLSKKGKDGKSLRETLEVVARGPRGMPPEGINPFEIPDILYDLWIHFQALASGRQVGMEGNPISESDIQAYCLNRRIQFEEWELKAIRLLDNVALERITFEEQEV